MGKSKPAKDVEAAAVKPARDAALVTLIAQLLFGGANDQEALLRRALAEGILLGAAVRHTRGP